MVDDYQRTATMGFRSGSASENDVNPRKNELHQRFRQARHMFRMGKRADPPATFACTLLSAKEKAALPDAASFLTD